MLLPRRTAGRLLQQYCSEDAFSASSTADSLRPRLWAKMLELSANIGQYLAGGVGGLVPVNVRAEPRLRQAPPQFLSAFAKILHDQARLGMGYTSPERCDASTVDDCRRQLAVVRDTGGYSDGPITISTGW